MKYVDIIPIEKDILTQMSVGLLEISKASLTGVQLSRYVYNVKMMWQLKMDTVGELL